MGCWGSTPAGPPPAETPARDLAGQVFLMVNGTSGGNAAQQLLTLGVDRFELDDAQGRPCRVSVFNLKDAASRAAGFAALAAEVNAGRANVRVVAAGGDGTVKWVLSELLRAGCASVPIGVIPFGTGNDFSRAMGFGASPPVPLVGKQLRALKARMRMVLACDVCELDVWQVEVRVRGGEQGGKFKTVRDGRIEETNVESNVMREEMINYFSIGADAQIVFEFEQHRTTSQWGNKLVYVQRGVRQLADRPRRLRKMVAALRGDDGQAIKFRPRDRVMAFLNIPSYSAGANPWSPSKKTGRFARQFVGDGLLELCTIHATTNVAVNLGTGSKIGITRTAQQGSYDLDFVEGARAFMQIDGEALLAENVESVSVRLGYRVSVLRSPTGQALSLGDGASARKPSTVSLPAEAPSMAIMAAKPATEDDDETPEDQEEEAELVTRDINEDDVDATHADIDDPDDSDDEQ